MSDINETVLNYYEEARDMGMNIDSAVEWAWERLTEFDNDMSGDWKELIDESVR